METTPAKLKVEVTNVRQVGGTLKVGLYQPGEGFGREDAKPFRDKQIEIVKPGSAVVEFDVVPGTYAIALFQDVNNNGRIDKNLIGYPKEPFGFSNDVRPRLAAPSFEDCAFRVMGKGATVSIKLLD